MPVIDFHIHVARAEDYRPWVIEWTTGNIGRDEAEAYINRYLAPDRINNLLDENGTLCNPASLWQWHAVWHFMTAVAIGLIFLYFRSEDDGKRVAAQK